MSMGMCHLSMNDQTVTLIAVLVQGVIKYAYYCFESVWFQFDMNKRTKSEFLRPNRVPNQPQHELTRNPASSTQNLQIQGQLSLLKQKIQQSKPILESIYDKVKRKEQKYQEQIRQQYQQCGEKKELKKQYRHFHHQSLKLLQQNNLFGQYQSQNHQGMCKGAENGEFQKLQRHNSNLQHGYQSLANQPFVTNHRDEGIKDIIQKYKQSRAKQRQSKQSASNQNSSVYQKYKNRLTQHKQSGKQNRESTLNKIRRLSKQIDQDLEQLSKDKSARVLKPEKTELKLQRHAKKDKKEYFLELQKRKLRNA